MGHTKRELVFRIILHTFFILFSLTFIIPFWFVVSTSFMGEDELLECGYRLIPAHPDLTAYQYIFSNPRQIIDAYAVTALTSFLGTLLSLIVMVLAAYPLSRSNYRLRKPITFFMFFTMLFSGGLIPTYILISQYLHLSNTLSVYILPGLASAWYIIIIRTFFNGLPTSLIESAKIDGASETRILIRIIIPLSKPVIATVALLTLLAKWNDWQTSLYYITNTRLYTLQYLLQRILREAEFLRGLMTQMPTVSAQYDTASTPPLESIKFAMAVVAAGPILIVFPFFQKYFTRGLTIGAVKG